MGGPQFGYALIATGLGGLQSAFLGASASITIVMPYLDQFLAGAGALPEKGAYADELLGL